MSVSRAVSRLLRVSALVCAAVLSCLSMCSASPVLTQVDNGVKHSILRSLHTPHDQKPPLVAPLPPETGAQSGTRSETRTSTEAWSIIDQPSNRQQFSYDENSSHSKRAGTAVTRVWTDHSEGGMRPVRSIFTRQTRANYQPVNTNTYDYPPIVRTSSGESGSPFYVFSQIWPPDNAPKPYDEVTYPGVFSLKTAGDEKCWTYSDLAFLPHLNGGYWTTVLRTPRGHYVGHEEANELAAGRVKSTSVPRTPSVSESWDASVIKSNPSLEKPTPSITDLTQGMNSETQTQQTSAVRGYSSVSSNLIRFQQSHRKAPSEEAQHPPDNVRQPYPDTAEPRYGAQTRTLTTHPPVTTISSAAPAPTRLSSLPASDKALESLAPVHHAGSQDSDGPGSEQPVVGRSVTKATRGSMHDHKPAQSTRRLYGFRGFENPMRRAGTRPPVASKRYGFDNKQLNVFKTANAFSSKSPNYSLQGASTTTATQVKHEKTPTHFSPASPGSHATIFTSGPQVWAESKTRFASRPHEGAEALVREPDKSATLQQDFEGFELRSSQFWQPGGSTIHRWYDQAGQAEQDASEISTRSQTKPGSKDFNSHLKFAVKPSRFSPDKFKLHHKSYAFLGVQPAQNPLTDSPAPRVSPAYLTPAGGLTVEPRLKSEPESEPVAVKARPVNIPTSSIARGTRVKGKRRQKFYKSISPRNNTAHIAVDRLPKSPTSVAYADIVGSASFSRVGEDHFSYFTATSRQKDNSGRPEAHAEDEEGDFSRVEEKKHSVEHEGGSSRMETLDALLNSERGGNRPVNHVLWPYFTKS